MMTPYMAAVTTLSNSTATGNLTFPRPSGTDTNYNEQLLYEIEAKAFKYVLDNQNDTIGNKAIDMMKNYLNTLDYKITDTTTFSLQVGNILTAGAMVYDWCYDLLDTAEKQFFIEKFIGLAKVTRNGYLPALNTWRVHFRGINSKLHFQGFAQYRSGDL